MWFSNVDHRNVTRSTAEIRYFYYGHKRFDLNITYVKMTSHQPKYRERIRFKIYCNSHILNLFFFFCWFHWSMWLPKVRLRAISSYFILFFLCNLKMLVSKDLTSIFNSFFLSPVFPNKSIQYGWWRSKIFMDFFQSHRDSNQFEQIRSDCNVRFSLIIIPFIS